MVPGESAIEYFFKMSQNRRLRRKLAKQTGYMKAGWQNVKDEFPPYNKPKDLGIKKFKRTGASYKDVLNYKLEANRAFGNN